MSYDPLNLSKILTLAFEVRLVGSLYNGLKIQMNNTKQQVI